MFHRVFKSLCPKSYLNECEPEFCAFRIEGSCPVINLIEELIDEFE